MCLKLTIYTILYSKGVRHASSVSNSLGVIMKGCFCIVSSNCSGVFFFSLEKNLYSHCLNILKREQDMDTGNSILFLSEK